MTPASPRAQFLTTLSLAGRKMRTLFDGLVRKRGLTLSRARLLLHLSNSGQVNQTELASVLELEHPTVVRLLDRLEALKLIERHAVENDRRAKQVRLTDKARPYLNEIAQVSDQMRNALLVNVNEEDLAITCRVLTQVIHNIEGLPRGDNAVSGQPMDRPV